MSAIDRLSKAERDVLMRTNIKSLIKMTVRALDHTKSEDLSVSWVELEPALFHIVTHARDEIFEARKRIAAFSRGKE
jgi:hypothetical protein